VADFCAISTWHPALAKCSGEGGNAVGTRRTLNIGREDGPAIVEELRAWDAAAVSYRDMDTKTDNSVLPFTTYSAFVTVRGGGDGGSIVECIGGFYRAYPKNNPPPALSDDAAKKAVEGVYDAGLASLKKLPEQ
jgi:hypothetical protein